MSPKIQNTTRKSVLATPLNNLTRTMSKHPLLWFFKVNPSQTPLNPLDSNIHPEWPTWAGRPFGPPAMASSEHMPPSTLPGVCEDLELPLRPVELCVETLEIDRLRGTAKLLFSESSRACRVIACYRYNKADSLQSLAFGQISFLLHIAPPFSKWRTSHTSISHTDSNVGVTIFVSLGLGTSNTSKVLARM